MKTTELTDSQLLAIVQAIAEHMDGWKAIQSENSHCYLKKDGREISVTYDRYKGRLHFFGQMPESGPHHQRFYFSSYDKIAKENVNDITVAYDRDPKAIAQDVTRRLLPGFAVRYEYAKESIDRSEKERLEKNERIRLACKLTGENFRDEWLRADAYPEVGYHGGIRIKVHSDFEVKFSIKSSADLTKIVEYIQYTKKASADKAARVKAAVEAAAAKAEPPVKTIWNSDGTDGPVLICTPPQAEDTRRCRECKRLWSVSYFGSGDGWNLCHDCHQAPPPESEVKS